MKNLIQTHPTIAGIISYLPIVYKLLGLIETSPEAEQTAMTIFFLLSSPRNNQPLIFQI